MKYYVVFDEDDPGFECESWEEAACVLREEKKQGLIVGPGLDYEYDEYSYRP